MSSQPVHDGASSPVTRRLGLGARMRALALLVPPPTRLLVDIGTNHGILPIAALRAQRALRCIATDRSEPALAETRRRLRRACCEDRVELRFGDGLLPVLDEAADVVCIAGMGSRRMVPILTTGLPLLRNRPGRLLLNPIGNCAAVSSAVAKNGYAIVAEECVTERGRDYTLLVAEPG